MTPIPVPRLWPGGTIAIIASGPSLTQSDVDSVRGRFDAVIVINRTYQMAPWADVLYGSDAHHFWTWHKGVPEFTGMKYTVWTDAKRRSVAEALVIPALQHTGDEGLDLNPTGLRTGYNSAYAAINLAVHFGAKRIVLLGVDMARGPRGQKHWHADYQDKSEPPYAKSLGFFQTIVAPLKQIGVEVVNCSPRSALTAFRKATLPEALSQWTRTASTVTRPPAPSDVPSNVVATSLESKRIAVLLMTCGRADYTRRTLESFTAQHPDAASQFLLLHGDDASNDSVTLPMVATHGFHTVRQHKVRHGARALRAALIREAAQHGAEWVVVLENDWIWQRPFPWALFEYLRTQQPTVYSLRLYGAYKAQGRQMRCATVDLSRGRRPVTWKAIPDAPEPAEMARIHWGAPPAVTRMAEALEIHAGAPASGYDPTFDQHEIAASGRIDADVARVVENVVWHIGTTRTAKPTASPAVARQNAHTARYTPAWQAQRRWTVDGATKCFDAALEALGRPGSMLDVGCGEGAIVRRANELGIQALGVDLSVTSSSENSLMRADLREPLTVFRATSANSDDGYVRICEWGGTPRPVQESFTTEQVTFDLVLCWEVAEHLPPSSADTLCDSLVRHLSPGGVLLFTAAKPGQRGDGHLNEQPPSYWRERFSARGLAFDPVLTERLSPRWSLVAPRQPWYSQNLQAFRAAGEGARFHQSDLPRVALTMRTADRSPKPNYVGGTIRRLVSQGVDPSALHLCVTAPDARWLDSQLGQYPVTRHVPDRRLTPNENGLQQIRVVDPASADWVMLLEDDLEFCQDFVPSVQRWLRDYGRSDRHLFRFFGFRVHPPSRGIAAYDWGIDGRFAGSQAVALRMTDALDFVEWADANMLTWGGFRGNAKIAFDKLLASWAMARWPKVPSMMSQPLFVRHIGDVSSIHPRTARNDALFAGASWTYRDPLGVAV